MTATDKMRGTLERITAFLAAHPSVPPPYITIYDHIPEVAELKWYLHINGKGGPEQQKRTAQQIIRSIGGTWDKSAATRDDSMDFTQERDGLSLQVTVVREAVCERVVVGTETVTVPAQPASEALPERTVEREVVEWRCASLLADEAVTA